MSKNPFRSENIRNYILANVSEHPTDIARMTAEKFNISRQAVNPYIRKLVQENLLTAEGTTRKKYALKQPSDYKLTLKVSPSLEEDVIWRKEIWPRLKHLKSNVLEICHYGFTEMLNNVVEHAQAKRVVLSIGFTGNQVSLIVKDNGVGIFNKIQQDFHLDDPKHALLELTKGKLTSDKKNHSGEGIFFTSRVFDRFSIASDKLFFICLNGKDWLVEEKNDRSGTAIVMSIDTNTTRTTRQVFDHFTAHDEDYGFSKTSVPVKLAEYEGDSLISRSQAKRLLTRFNLFKEVWLDFKDVESIGQAFADEIFRVFKNNYPEVALHWINAKPQVEKMIQRALNVKI